MASEDTETGRLRFNTWNSRESPVLEQQWQCRRNFNELYYEWRAVPFVEIEPDRALAAKEPL